MPGGNLTIFKPHRDYPNPRLIEDTSEDEKEESTKRFLLTPKLIAALALVLPLKSAAVKGVGKVKKSVGKIILSVGEYRKFD